MLVYNVFTVRVTHETMTLLPPWHRLKICNHTQQTNPKRWIVDLLVCVPALVSPVAMVTVTATRSFILFGAT